MVFVTVEPRLKCPVVPQAVEKERVCPPLLLFYRCGGRPFDIPERFRQAPLHIFQQRIRSHPFLFSPCWHGDYIPLIFGLIILIITDVNFGEGCSVIKFDRLRANDNMETKTLNKLCIALDCTLEDIAEYSKEE